MKFVGGSCRRGEMSQGGIIEGGDVAGGVVVGGVVVEPFSTMFKNIVIHENLGKIQDFRRF